MLCLLWPCTLRESKKFKKLKMLNLSYGGELFYGEKISLSPRLLPLIGIWSKYSIKQTTILRRSFVTSGGFKPLTRKVQGRFPKKTFLIR